MKNNSIISLLFIFLFGLFSIANAQEKKLEKADESFEHLHYIDAQKIYLQVAEKGFESEELFTKLANTYYFNAKYDEAAKWYARLFDFTPEPQNPITLLHYSQALKATSNDSLATQYYDTYISKTSQKAKPTLAVDYLELIQLNSGRYELQTLKGVYDKNQISFGHTKVDNKLIYASTQTTKTFLNKRSAWDGLSFLSLYEIELDAQNIAIGKPKKLKGELSSEFHESLPYLHQRWQHHVLHPK